MKKLSIILVLGVCVVVRVLIRDHPTTVKATESKPVPAALSALPMESVTLSVTGHLDDVSSIFAPASKGGTLTSGSEMDDRLREFRNEAADDQLLPSVTGEQRLNRLHGDSLKSMEVLEYRR